MNKKKMKGLSQRLLVFVLALSMVLPSFSVALASSNVSPDVVNLTLSPGGSATVLTSVATPVIPPEVEVCVVQDETGSFNPFKFYLQAAASALFDIIKGLSPNAKFAVAGFRDYPIGFFGGPLDWFYHLLSGMSPEKADWLAGIASLTAGGGGDTPESQYDAIVAAATGVKSCGFSSDPNTKKVIMMGTDAPFHTPDGTHQNDLASTIAVLNAEKITFVGLKAYGAGDEMNALAAATGGSVQALSSDGTNIASAITAGLNNLPVTVTPSVVGCSSSLSVIFTPGSQTVVGGNDALFTGTIAVLSGAPQGTTADCGVIFKDGNGNELGTQSITVTIPDKTAPVITCELGVNPSGKNVPSKNAGFRVLKVTDNVDGVNVNLSINGFGPFANGDTVKITIDDSAVPEMKKIGGGKADADIAHLILNGDAVLTATDSSGNVSSIVCFSK